MAVLAASAIEGCEPSSKLSDDSFFEGGDAILTSEDIILSEFDVYAVVGGNRPLHMRDIRVTVESDGAFVINFKGVRGSPMVCAICIRKTVAIAEQVLDRQADQLRSVSQKYEYANKLWAAAISNLENKIKVMKQEQTLLSLEARWPCKRCS
ncbi:hypothetical protein OsJ_07481 [Oryza sativa Japonica Group]|uniref:Uncharacterized protein n=1 Tax=Oryza sativa subsp. japonica TaxID=39947 RepID=B9F108_ORYSJ|nr:hypothetical protein OsJ_07481 [Oryza sativa Japonica Group]